MSRSFAVSADSPASVERVRAAYGNKDYWRARLADFGSGTATLDTWVVDADGAVRVAMTVSLLRERLPSRFDRIHRGVPTFVYEETWGGLSGEGARGEASVSVPGAPLSGLGVLSLVPAQNGSRLTCTATVEVRVPLVGGAIESVICAQLTDGVRAIQRFTTSWIAAHG